MYICGRIKDLIILNGVNRHPQDLEFAAQDVSTAVRPGCVAAFASNEVDDESSVDVVFETRRQRVAEAERVCAEIRSAVVQLVGIPIDHVVAIAERTIPKTPSGKSNVE
jgi:acyl-CoA synthetase (AMP-forming)/AMP-acid ligase II